MKAALSRRVDPTTGRGRPLKVPALPPTNHLREELNITWQQITDVFPQDCD